MRVWLLLVGAFFLAIPTQALSSGNDSFQQRRNWLLSLDWDASEIAGSPKLGMPFALAKLYQSQGSDTQSIDYTTRALAESNDATFDPIGVVRAVYQYRESFSAEQLATIATEARQIRNWTGGGTENHRLMRWTNGYLLAQEFGGEWYPGHSDRTWSSDRLMAELKDSIMREGRYRFHHSGTSEYLSPNYLQHHLIPLLNLYDFARDRDLQDAAAALLHLHLTHLALNVHQGYILEPYTRSIGNQFTAGSNGHSNGTQYLTWLYWGHIDPPSSRLQNRSWEGIFALYFTLTTFSPLNALDDLANGTGSIDYPYRTKSAGMTWPHTSDRLPRTDLRSVYRDRHYSIGMGYHSHVPGGFYLQHSKFGIAWTSDDALAYLQSGHPYWRSDEGQTNWWEAPTSPFHQIAHDRNTAIALFNIPERDPWPNAGRADWVESRNKHAEGLIREAMIRFPLSVDEVQTAIVDEESNQRWYFVREGSVYIGIRALTTSYTESVDSEFGYIYAPGNLNGERYQTGFIFEVGTQSEFGSWEKFQQQLLDNPIHIHWGEGEIPTPDLMYTDSQGDRLRLRFNSNLASDSDGVVDNLPQVWINDDLLPYDNWPDMQGPGVSLIDGVLSVEGDRLETIVDWSQNTPSITQRLRFN